MATQASTTKCDVSLLLVGKTGVGKSATGNSILNLKGNPFRAAFTDTSVTSTCQFEYSRYQGRNIKVVDMPGLADSSKDKADDIKAIEKEAITAVYETPDGYDAILFVARAGRQSKEDTEIVDSLKGIFGEKFLGEYGILVVTNIDDYNRQKGEKQPCKKFWSEQEGSLKQFYDKCGQRAVLFDNVTDEVEEKQNQRKQLFDLVDAMGGKRRYTPDLFKKAKAKRDELIAKSEDLVLTDGIKSTLRLMMHDLGDVQLETPGDSITQLDDSITQLDEIKTRAQEFASETKSEEKKVKKMKAVLAVAEAVVKVSAGKTELVAMMKSMLDSTASSEEFVRKAKKELESKKKAVKNDEAKLEELYEKLLQEDIPTKTLIAISALLVLGFALPIAFGAAGGFVAGGAACAVGKGLVGRALGAIHFSSLLRTNHLKKVVSKNKNCKVQ